MITGIITYLLLRLTWHEVPEVKSLITLKRKIINFRFLKKATLKYFLVIAKYWKF